MKRTLLILLIVFFTTLYAEGQTRASTLPALPSINLIHFYPNPATSYITFDFQKSLDKGYTLEVYSFLGKKMYQATNLNQKTTLDLSEFNRGVYIYQLRDNSGKMIASGKFQVSK